MIDARYVAQQVHDVPLFNIHLTPYLHVQSDTLVFKPPPKVFVDVETQEMADVARSDHTCRSDGATETWEAEQAV